MNTSPNPNFSSQAWLLKGLVNSLPGRLSFKNERLTYCAYESGTFRDTGLKKLERTSGVIGLSDKLKQGKEVSLFDIHLSDLQRVYFPWWYFGAGMKLTIKDQEYRLSFIRPQNTQAPSSRTSISDVMANGSNLDTGIGTARACGKRWKELLTIG